MKIPSYTETEEVEIDGAKFLVGAIPHGRYRVFLIAAAQTMEAAKRRALLALKAEGVAVPTPDQVKASMDVDPLYELAAQDNQAEVVAWAIRGHSGIDGIAFVGQEREYLGVRYAGASKETVGAYAAAGILGQLFLAAARRNELSPAQKKSSPPPSEPTDGSSTATTA